MSRSYPIWSQVNSPCYMSDKSFGARGGFSQDIFVGSSAKNSHLLARISVQQYEAEDGHQDFTLYIDGHLHVTGILRDKKFTRTVFGGKNEYT